MSPSNSKKLEQLKKAAEISDFGFGVWAYDTWESHNEIYFSNQLKVGGINWGLTPHGATLGYYTPWRNHITLHISLVNPKTSAWNLKGNLGEKYASDVLLHEMIHQAIHQLFQERPKEIHNNKFWVTEVNRIAPLLGLKPNAHLEKVVRIKGGGVKRMIPPGFMTRSELASWPYSQRPENYYKS